MASSLALALLMTAVHRNMCLDALDQMLHRNPGANKGRDEQEQEQERSPGYILPTPLQFIYTTRS